jgi:hypothetical protein
LKSIVLALFLLVSEIILFALGFLRSVKGLWIIGGVLLLCVGMFFYTINVNVKRTCNSNAKTVRAKQNVTFGKNGFVFELLFNNEEENERDEIFYDELDAVYFAAKAIYLYIEKRSVIIIPKRNLNISPIEAREFLKKYIDPQKLVICV